MASSSTRPDRSTPFTFVDGSELPPDLPNRYQGQEWASWKNRFDTAGLFGHTTFGDWRISAGAFHHVIDSKRSFNTLFVDAQGDGSANYVVNIHPPRKTTSNAAEVRLSRQFDEGPRHHVVHLSVKGRTRTGDFGGEQVVDFGPVMVDEEPPNFREPTVEFGEETRDEVRQYTAGLAYHGRWQGVGEISVGIQKTHYRKSVEPPDDPDIVTRADPWLLNGTLAINLVKGLVAYAGYTQGLEDSNVAPEIAVNRSEAPPALVTSQRDSVCAISLGRCGWWSAVSTSASPISTSIPASSTRSSAPSAIAASRSRWPASRSRGSTSSPAPC